MAEHDGMLEVSGRLLLSSAVSFRSYRIVDCGFSVDAHVGCDDRISLYPAAPLRLATMLYAWTIAPAGRDSSLARQTGWARSANPHNSHTSDPPDAPERAPELKMLTSPLSLSAGEHRALRNEALLQEAP
jgi:hypothetical protein